MPYIIWISGASGAGKSTIAKALAKKLNATVIYWDEYDEISKAQVIMLNGLKKGKIILDSSMMS